MQKKTIKSNWILLHQITRQRRMKDCGAISGIGMGLDGWMDGSRGWDEAQSANKGINSNLSREVSIKSIFSLHSISLGLSVLEWMELPITLMISMLSEMRIQMGAKATMMLQPIFSSVLIEHLPHFPSKCVIRSSSLPSAFALSQTSTRIKA